MKIRAGFTENSSSMETHESYMSRALALARKADGRTSPNPMVGAVIVKNGTIVGEGWHKKAGLPHGEIVALRKAGPRAKGAQLYVNLEPCCHYGKTPPCTDAIVAAGIRKVVVGMKDPNPRMRGKGLRQLRKSGIEVETGILEKECRRLNEVFAKFIQTGRPFVILKAAMSLDGKIATRSGQSRWITGVKAREEAHRMRGRVDAILVGTGTVVKDNPFLTTRLRKKAVKHPVRVILDHNHRIPLTANVFKNTGTQRTLYATGTKPPAPRKEKLLRKGVEILVVREKDRRADLKHLMTLLGGMGVTSVLIEGGGEVHASALRDGIVDRAVFFVAPIIIGGREAAAAVSGEGIGYLKKAWKIKNMEIRLVGEDLMVEGTL
ncbi:MAG: bifunctional diaminohydroxyphosphoribosylaminopyrimidine deaminase/5-amino-6-(5-phosphoribosylamino)uracil reductase RibD [Nitrospinaceae bacterium]